MPTRDLGKNQELVSKELAKNTINTVKAAEENYRIALEQIQKEIDTIYRKYAVEGKLSYSNMVKFNRLKKLEGEIISILSTLYNKQVKQIDRAIEIQVQQSYYRYAWSIEQNVGISLNWGIIRDAAVQASVSNPLYKIAKDRLRNDGKRKILQTITQGIIQGTSIQDLSKLLASVLGISLNDAIRIIRTEMHTAQEIGHLETFLTAGNLGLEVKRMLVSTLDNRTRPQSAQMDGDYANEEGKFKYPNGEYYLPGDPSMPGKWRINDRERSIEIIEGMEPKLRRSKEDGVIPYTTFRDWAKEKNIIKNKYGQILFPGISK